MATNEIRLVLVTPEKTLLDAPVSSLRFPLIDGQIGILPGRAPMVGRLGYGELSFHSETGVETVYYIDGGFVQVKGSEVSILTSRAIKPENIDAAAAEADFQEARDRKATGDVEIKARYEDQERARQLKAAARSK
ncbi:ATP synthase epsilon chain, sodium ion specific [Polystyrenella longa]|uniref:ATP synthase epsilon chain n=1 Tax=Polystyrenella longa TaxID=2528007 RepID=A0A518CHN4_9PLAN|nr:F0F1 ATP synthase subunit epsilon [Polystyrenella longa]QDU78739.1 ATP synthase epsilon chain, sodium ion specific [Polystyrenella longa]